MTRVVDSQFNPYLSQQNQKFFQDACGVTSVSIFRSGGFHEDKDYIEYAMFFWNKEESKKYRADFTEKISVLDSIYHGGYSEWFMVGRAVEIIHQGDYVEVKPNGV